ncbi:MAG TPA: glycosyltransferase [Thermoanaerobaculia bacterium]|nr:glycosyltransferase [Thermoanaerobaculia bacterium]
MTAISVVMAVYNGAPTLAATLDSILGQTEHDFECIVVDDGSTDATPEILSEYATRDPRIRVIHQQNAGLTRALITGCAAAHGLYIARQDCGDTSDPLRFALQKQLMDRNPALVFVSSWTAFTGPEGEPLYVTRGSGAAASPIAILDPEREWGVVDGPTSHPSVMMLRDSYERAGGYRAAFAVGQDWDLWYRLAALGKFQIVQQILYTASVTPDGISGGAREAQQTLAELSRASMLARLRGDGDEEIVRRAAAVPIVHRKTPHDKARGLYAIGAALRRQRDPRARGYFRRAIALNPLFVKAWIRYAQSFL